jgi:RNA polymerase sigma factor (TIGR02999 family)
LTYGCQSTPDPFSNSVWCDARADNFAAGLDEEVFTAAGAGGWGRHVLYSGQPSTRAAAEPAMSEVTRILSALDHGDAHAAEQLFLLVYDELRRMAAARLAQERPGQTLQATALVHEAYLRLVGAPATDTPPQWQGRAHFFAAAAEAMRRILVEQARRKGRHKHGGGRPRLDIDLADLVAPLPDEEVLALDEAMTRFAAQDPQRARLVQLRFYVGLSNDEAAQVLGISAITAKRYWRYARAWLHREVRKGDDPAPEDESAHKS